MKNNHPSSAPPSPVFSGSQSDGRGKMLDVDEGDEFLVTTDDATCMMHKKTSMLIFASCDIWPVELKEQ